MGSHSLSGMHRVEEDVFFRRHGYYQTPRLVQWLVTGRCPLRCAHCLSAPLRGCEPDLAQAERVIDQVAALGVSELLITGGEPLAREDFGSLVEMLATRAQPWSLNTAVWPDARARRAMEVHPPRFVAVSLDGPPEIHDRLRGRAGAFEQALAALAWYAELCDGAVAAGTTVTALNVDDLEATFPLVLASGAASWGLHLLVPEGRAATRRALDLSPSQERRLLRFIAAKRAVFPVELADELGFCGPFEPLVRGAPFFCGAGRAGCVILPDGEVVPCTTTDRSTSAGNLFERPLVEIWGDGFTALRRPRLSANCRRCDAVALCGGGCWLRRRRATACAKPVWQTARIASAACLATLLAWAAPAGAEPSRPDAPVQSDARDKAGQGMQILQRSIVQWYAAQLGGRRAPEAAEVLAALRRELPDDPGARYFLAFAAGRRPRDLAGLAGRIEAALGTGQRSLCLIGLAFRDVLQWTLSAPEPGERSADDRARVRDLLGRLGRTAEHWRRQVFADGLDPFLRRPEHYRRFLISKAGPTALQRVEGKLARSRGWTQPDLGAAFLKLHGHAESMRLAYQAVPDGGLRVWRQGQRAPDDGRLGIFDLLLTPLRPVTIQVTIAGQELVVLLPPAAELAYGDVLRVTYAQHRPALDRLVTGRQGSRLRDPWLLPALLARLASLSDEQAAERRRLRWLLTDLFLF